MLNQVCGNPPHIDDGWGFPRGDVEMSLSGVPFIWPQITPPDGDGSTETCGYDLAGLGWGLVGWYSCTWVASNRSLGWPAMRL